MTVNDAAAIKIVRRKLYRNLIVGKNANVMAADFTGYMGEHYMPVGQFHIELSVGKSLNYNAVNFYSGFFAGFSILRQPCYLHI